MKAVSSLIERSLKVARERSRDRLSDRMVGTDRVRKRNVFENSGTYQLNEMMRLLDCFGLQRSKIQKDLHRGMVGSVLQRIFTNDSDADMKLGMVTHKLKSSRQQFMAITPR